MKVDGTHVSGRGVEVDRSEVSSYLEYVCQISVIAFFHDDKHGIGNSIAQSAGAKP